MDEIQRAMGYIGQPYCAIFVLYCYQKACDELKIKNYLPPTASSQTLFEWANKGNFVYTDPEYLKPGDIAVWRKYKLWQGHVGLVTSPLLDLKEMSFQTIEGNTSNNDYGSQRDGDGIYRRIRYAKKMDFDVDGFYLRGFIDVAKIFNGEMSNEEFVNRLMNNEGLPLPAIIV